LIAGITAANQSSEADTITLAPGKTFTLKQVNNTSSNGYGSNGLPSITAAGGSLTIVGNGDIIERSTGRQTPAFRVFEVQAGAALSLQNLTLQGGSAGVGGAVYSLGTLTMTGVTVQKNTANVGGGIYSNGSLLVQDCVIQNNQAVGADGNDGFKVNTDPWGGHGNGGGEYFPPTAGGWGVGGGVYVAGGTAQLLGTTVTHNSAKGGQGGQGKYGQPNAPDGFGVGGGLYIGSSATVVLDVFTLAHVVDNTADFDADIYGTFTVS
jgi:hypothetical protein